MKRHFNFQDIRRQQFEVAIQGHSEMPRLVEWIDIGVSAIISVLYETANVKDLDTNAGKVQSMAWLWIYKSVFTVSASFQCAELGFYAESASLNRGLIETLVQVIYLERHPNEISKLPSQVNGKKRKLKFATMFEAIAPGYYAKYYAMASEFIHPGWGSNAYKISRDVKGQGTVDQGVIYKLDRLTGCFNELVVLLLGFLRSMEILFIASDWTSATFEAWQNATIALQSVLDSHIEFKGGPNDWHRLSEPFWKPAVPPRQNIV